MNKHLSRPLTYRDKFCSLDTRRYVEPVYAPVAIHTTEQSLSGRWWCGDSFCFTWMQTIWLHFPLSECKCWCECLSVSNSALWLTCDQSRVEFVFLLKSAGLQSPPWPWSDPGKGICRSYIHIHYAKLKKGLDIEMCSTKSTLQQSSCAVQCN